MTILFKDVQFDDVSKMPGKDVVLHFSHTIGLLYNRLYPSGTTVNDKLIHESRKEAQQFMKRVLKQRNKK